MKRILVTGINGTVGNYIRQVCPDNIELVAYDRNRDIDSYESIDVVLHLAAYTNVAMAHLELDSCFRGNVLLTQTIAEYCKDHDIPMIHVSTLYINGHYSESRCGSKLPFDTYTYTKYLAEAAVRGMKGKYIIIRTGAIFGKDSNGFDKKFVGTMYNKMINNEKISINKKNMLVNPTYAKDFAQYLLQIASIDFRDSYTDAFVNVGTASLMDYASEIKSILNSTSEIVYTDNASDLKEDYTYDKAGSLRFKTPYARPWRIALKEYINEELATSI